MASIKIGDRLYGGQEDEVVAEIKRLRVHNKQLMEACKFVLAAYDKRYHGIDKLQLTVDSISAEL